MRFSYALCEALHVAHPNRLTYAEVIQWYAYFEIKDEPIQYGKYFEYLKAKLDGNSSEDRYSA